MVGGARSHWRVSVLPDGAVKACRWDSLMKLLRIPGGGATLPDPHSLVDY